MHRSGIYFRLSLFLEEVSVFPCQSLDNYPRSMKHVSVLADTRQSGLPELHPRCKQSQMQSILDSWEFREVVKLFCFKLHRKTSADKYRFYFPLHFACSFALSGNIWRLWRVASLSLGWNVTCLLLMEGVGLHKCQNDQYVPANRRFHSSWT